MTKRIIIPGPPGTGKTYRLINTYLNVTSTPTLNYLKERNGICLNLM